MIYNVECAGYHEFFDSLQEAIDYATDLLDDNFSWSDWVVAEIFEGESKEDESGFRKVGEVGYTDPEIMFFES